MRIRNLTPDVIFLDPADIRDSAIEPFSVFKHTKPELTQLLAKSLDMSERIGLKLPSDVDVNELPQLFHDVFEKHEL